MSSEINSEEFVGATCHTRYEMRRFFYFWNQRLYSCAKAAPAFITTLSIVAVSKLELNENQDVSKKHFLWTHGTDFNLVGGPLASENSLPIPVDGVLRHDQGNNTFSSTATIDPVGKQATDKRMTHKPLCQVVQVLYRS